MTGIQAIYNFIVGDMIILAGVLLAVGVVALVEYIDALAPLRVIAGTFLILAAIAVLTATLIRETRQKPA